VKVGKGSDEYILRKLATTLLEGRTKKRPAKRTGSWRGQVSILRPPAYEAGALPLSYPTEGRRASDGRRAGERRAAGGGTFRSYDLRVMGPALFH
jgi:hypothetical protein